MPVANLPRCLGSVAMPVMAGVGLEWGWGKAGNLPQPPTPSGLTPKPDLWALNYPFYLHSPDSVAF